MLRKDMENQIAMHYANVVSGQLVNNQKWFQDHTTHRMVKIVNVGSCQTLEVSGVLGIECSRTDYYPILGLPSILAEQRVWQRGICPQNLKVTTFEFWVVWIWVYGTLQMNLEEQYNQTLQDITPILPATNSQKRWKGLALIWVICTPTKIIIA